MKIKHDVRYLNIVDTVKITFMILLCEILQPSGNNHAMCNTLTYKKKVKTMLVVANAFDPNTTGMRQADFYI